MGLAGFGLKPPGGALVRGAKTTISALCWVTDHVTVEAGATPGYSGGDSGVILTLVGCDLKSFWPRLTYPTSINQKLS
eukprot:COSAG02_NODE_1611_length_11677_cov_2.985662_2_plen_78_part_00